MKKIFIICISSLLLAACHSSRHAAKGDGTGQATRSQQQLSTLVASVNAQRQKATGIRAKMNMRLALGSKSASVGGTLKMKRDEAIQLSLTALGLLEIGRMELTPSYFFIQDRIHKQYMRMAWDEIAAFQRAGINFDVFQALFWDELFVPGKQGLPSEKDFTLDFSDEQPQLATDRSRELLAQFTIHPSRNLVEKTAITSSTRTNVGFDCQYRDWEEVDKSLFPNNLQLKVRANSRTIDADISLSRIQADDDLGSLVTTPGSNYKEVSFDTIIRILSNLQ